MSYHTDQDAAGGLSDLHQEQQAAETIYEQRIDDQLKRIDDALSDRAKALALTLRQATTEHRERLILETLRDTLKIGVEAAGSGAIAARILGE